MSQFSPLSHVVEMQLYVAVGTDDYKKCETLLRTEAVSDSLLESLTQRAVADGCTRSLEVFLDHATTSPWIVLVSGCAQRGHMIKLNILKILLELRRRSCGVRMSDETEFTNYIRDRANVRHVSLDERMKCAALILVHNETRPDRHQCLLKDLQRHVQQSQTVLRADALASITSEPMRMWAAFALIRRRATEICIGMQDLCLPAPITIEILEAACYPPESHPKHYDVWRLVTKVKHFLPRD